MDCQKRLSKLMKISELQFVAVELNLYLDTHPCDQEALNDYNCAAERLEALKKEYEAEFGPLLNFGFSEADADHWQWIDSPWPWEM